MPKVLINGVPTDVSLDQIFQDDGTTPFGTPNAPTGRTFTEEDIARARSEEKDKLYNQLSRTNEELTALREQVGGLTAEQQRREAALAEEQKRLEEEARSKEEQELSARELVERKNSEWERRLQETEQSFNQRLEAQEQARQQAEALVAKEREFSELRQYVQDQIAENRDKIAPQLVQFVSGNTREEVDANIARAIQSTDAITAEMQQMLPQTGEQQQQQFQQPQQQTQTPVPPGVTPFSGPSAMDPAGQYNQQITPEQIAGMDMNEYSKLRGTLGIGGQNNNRGLYG